MIKIKAMTYLGATQRAVRVYLFGLLIIEKDIEWPEGMVHRGYYRTTYRILGIPLVRKSIADHGTATRLCQKPAQPAEECNEQAP